MQRFSLIIVLFALLTIDATFLYVDPSGSDSGNGPYKTIGYAISIANSNDTISINNGLYNGTGQNSFNLTSIPFLFFTSSSGIATNTIIDLGEKNQFMTVYPSTTVTVNGIKFTRGKSTSNGGVAVITGKAEFTDCIFQNNYARNRGAVFFVSGNGSKLKLKNAQFIANKLDSGSQGGAVAVENYGHFEWEGGVAKDQYGGSRGGVIAATTSAFVNITTVSFLNNQVSNGNGGVIYASMSSTINMSAITATGNLAASGGFAALDRSLLWLTRAWFDGHVVSTDGGVIQATQSSITIHNSTFYANTASTGGAVRVQDSTGLFIKSSSFVNNTASKGGAFCGSTSSTLTFSHSRFIANSASSGGAFSFDGKCDIKFLKTEISGNLITSDNGGAGILCSNSKMSFNQTSLSNNRITTGTENEITCSKFPSYTTCKITSENGEWDSACPSTNSGSNAGEAPHWIWYLVAGGCTILGLTSICVCAAGYWRWKRDKKAKTEYQMFDKIQYEEGYEKPNPVPIEEDNN